METNMSKSKREFKRKTLAEVKGVSLIEVVASQQYGSVDNPQVEWTTLFTAFPNKSGTGLYSRVPRSISIQPGAELNFFIKEEVTDVKSK